MACMCGDLYCPNCGPAQGNSHCRQCGKWTDEGGCEDPEECARLDQLCDEAEAQYWMEQAEKERWW